MTRASYDEFVPPDMAGPQLALPCDGRPVEDTLAEQLHEARGRVWALREWIVYLVLALLGSGTLNAALILRLVFKP